MIIKLKLGPIFKRPSIVIIVLFPTRNLTNLTFSEKDRWTKGQMDKRTFPEKDRFTNGHERTDIQESKTT